MQFQLIYRADLRVVDVYHDGVLIGQIAESELCALGGGAFSVDGSQIKALLSVKQEQEARERTTMDWDTIEKVVKTCADLGINALLYGPPGTGKSYCARTHALGDSDAFPLNLTPDCVAAEARGYDRLVNGEFLFCKGPALLAWERGGRLVLEEVDKASGDMYSFLLGVLDDQKIASLIMPDERLVRPKKGFHCVATSNLETPEDLPEALRDRFPVCIKVSTPHPKAIALLSKDLRKPAERTGLIKGARACSVRAFKAYDALRDRLENEAAEAVFGSGWKDVLNAIKTANAS